MNNEDEEFWVSDPKFVCLVSKFDNQYNKLLIVKQGLLYIDFKIQMFHVEEQSNMKVDKLSKKGINDLLLLNEQNEHNYLHTIRVRYHLQKIYTQVGTHILIAINPYQFVPELYSPKEVKVYQKEIRNLNYVPKDQLQQKLREIEPHLYKVAQISLDQLFENESKFTLRICSIIISGESGSGKTESTKLILKYLASEQLEQKSQQVTLEQQVFASNPLLEAFGNAKTARNDNSSRFGKFIHLYFNPKTKRIATAQIDNYLLEKSRVVKLSPVERNYHIFYQLIAAQIPELKLGSASQYNYLKYGDLKFIKNELEEFKETVQSMNQMNFTRDEQNYIFQVLAGILHLGNINIRGENNKSFLEEDFSLSTTCELLGLTVDDFTNLICKVLTKMGKESILKENSTTAAISARDTLAKYIYEKLFNWLIIRVNQKLSVQEQNAQTQYMIGILDIFGFEIFMDENGIHTNSFEQLNINFTNEKLQHHFNTHMLEAEQSEYNQEKIIWNHVQFPDNRGIINVIENSSSSIYKLLIDQTIAPKGNDKDLSKQIKNLSKEYVFGVLDLLNANTDVKVEKNHRKVYFDWFGIKHFTGCVIYNVTDFVDKNKDTINQEVHLVLPTSKNPILREIWKDHKIVNPNIKQDNVVTRFQNSLSKLLEVLNSSIPKYIRCIKPNNNKLPFEFDSIEVRRQMKCAGLMEAIQIRKAGYEIRLNHEDFMKKYRCLIKEKPESINQMMLLLEQNSLIKSKLQSEIEVKNLQIGTTKIFMKESLRNFLDQKLVEFRLTSVTKIQISWRKFIFKKTVQDNLKLLIIRHHKLLKSIKRFIVLFKLNKRIEKKKQITVILTAIHKLKVCSLKQGFSQLNKYFISLKENDKLLADQQKKKQIKREVELSSQIKKNYQQSEKKINSNSNSESQTIRKTFSVVQLQFLKLTNSKYTYTYDIKMYKEAFQESQGKLQKEQQNRRDLENEIRKLKKELNQKPQESNSINSSFQDFDILSHQQTLEEIPKLKFEIINLNIEKNKYKQEAEDKVKSLEQSLKQAKVTEENLRQLLEEANIRCEMVSQDCRQLMSTKNDSENMLKDEWNNEKQTLMSELEDAKIALQDLNQVFQREVKKLSSGHELVKSQLLGTEEKLRSDVDDLKEKLQNLSSENENLKSQLLKTENSHQIQIQYAKQKLQAIQSENESLKFQQLEMQEANQLEIQQLSIEADYAKQKLQKLQQEHETVKSQLLEAVAGIQTLKQENERQILSFYGEKEKLQAQYKIAQAEQLENLNKVHASQIEEVEQRCLAKSQNDTLINELKDEISKKDQEIEELQEELKALVKSNQIKIKIFEANTINERNAIKKIQQKKKIDNPIRIIIEKEKQLLKQFENLIKQNAEELEECLEQLEQNG